MMTGDELRKIALGVVSENQSAMEDVDDAIKALYTVAYNDGVLDLMNAILEQKGEII